MQLKNVDLPRWEKNSNITINDLGFRDNKNNFKENDNQRILLVGDSITFGSQVTDINTWSSCLERETKIQAKINTHEAKIQQEKGTGERAQLRARASAHKIRHCACLHQ